MTQNQIAFFRAKEEQRHNVTTETETSRHNVADESIRYEANAINREANVINQMHFERMDAENARHNLAQEDIGYGNISLGYANLDEVSRHNLVSEKQNQTQLKIRKAELKETKRHNKAGEKVASGTLQETIRHNYAQEGIGWTQASASQAQAAAAGIQANAAQQNAATNALATKYNYEMTQWQNRINSRDARTREKAQQALSKLQASQIDLNDAKAVTEWITHNYQDDRVRSEIFRNYMQGLFGSVSDVAGAAGQFNSPGKLKP